MRAALSLEYHYTARLPVCQCPSPKRHRKPHLQHTETSFAYKPIIPTWKYKTLPENNLLLNTIHGKHAKIIDAGLERKRRKIPLLSNPLVSGPGKQEGIIPLLKAANCMDTTGKSHIIYMCWTLTWNTVTAHTIYCIAYWKNKWIPKTWFLVNAVACPKTPAYKTQELLPCITAVSRTKSKQESKNCIETTCRHKQKLWSDLLCAQLPK